MYCSHLNDQGAKLRNVYVQFICDSKPEIFILRTNKLVTMNYIVELSNSPFTLGAVVTRTAFTRDGTVVLTKIFSVHAMKNEHASAVSNCRILLTTPI